MSALTPAARLSQTLQVEYKTEKVGRIKSFDLSVNGNPVQANNFDVALINRYVQGRNDVTISFTCEYYFGDTNGIEAIIADKLTNTSGALVIEPVGTLVVGDHIWTAAGFIRDVNLSGQDDEVPEISFDYQVSEVFTFAKFTI